MFSMKGYLCWVLISVSLCDHQYHLDYNTYSHYYPDYSYNFTSPAVSTRQKRIFEDSVSLFASLSIRFDVSIPLDDLNSAIYISVPFSFRLPDRASTKSDFGSGRSLTGGAPSRLLMYKHLENYVAQMTGSDGHKCLLRAMCETSATPLHDDGLLGDAINFLLTGSYSAADAVAVDKSYFEAQAKGQLSGDCSSYHQNCPVSFFKYLG